MGVRSPGPTPGPPAPDSSAREISPHNCWLQKSVEIELEETSGALGSSLKELIHGLTYSDSLPLSSSTRVAAYQAPVSYKEKLKCLASR